MSTMAAAQKLEFYATNEKLIYRMIPLIGRLIVREEHKQDNYVLSLRRKFNADASTKLTFAEYLFWDLFNKEQFDKIHEYVYLHNPFKVNIVDFFAGEGRWLEIFKKFFENSYTIANELEEGRAKICKQSKLIDFTFCGAYEDLSFIQQSVNVLLFNPPYDTINRVSCAEWYLNDIIKKQYLCTGSNIIILVLNKKDMFACADTLINNYTVDLVYKAHEEEFNKWGQYVVIAEGRYCSLSDSGQHALLQKEVALFKSKFDNAPEHIEHGVNNPTGLLRGPDISFQLHTIALSRTIPERISPTKTELWKSIIQLTSVKSMESAQLVTPRIPKPGELSQIIAAGYINGEVNDSHIVVGGVKLVETNTLRVNDRGKEEVSSLRASVPYLNITYRNENGDICIKELLKSGSTVIDESELDIKED